ncbi:MAG: hypothetical protein Q7O66_16550 [Dehalococcoidia bacterium]|nr:hypothetical protein [Dehalococcoidia bacterium]
MNKNGNTASLKRGYNIAIGQTARRKGQHNHWDIKPGAYVPPVSKSMAELKASARCELSPTGAHFDIEVNRQFECRYCHAKRGPAHRSIVDRYTLDEGLAVRGY